MKISIARTTTTTISLLVAAPLRIGAFFFVGPSASRNRPSTTTMPWRRAALNMVDGGAVADAVSTAMLSSTMPASALLLPVLSLDTTTTSVLTAPPEAGGISYSKTSYYAVLGLYLMSFPGVWSAIQRSTSAKIKRKTYVSLGERATAPAATAVQKSNVKNDNEVVNANVASSSTVPASSDDTATTTNNKGMSLRQQAGEIMAYMKSNNYEVVEAGETIVFRGVVQRSLSQAFFLTFCTALGLLSLALVLQIQFNSLSLPVLGEPNWFLLALLSPYAGIYYWRSGDRIDECSVKLMANEDETENEITVQGSEEELERMWRTLNWSERGMVKIESIL